MLRSDRAPSRLLRRTAGCVLVLLMTVLAPRPRGGASADETATPRAIAPDGHEFRLEIASTPEQRARGYMFRSHVGKEEGMLFIFPRSDFHAFWMKNCLVSLDILWLSEDLTVVFAQSDVPPCKGDPCPSYPAMSKARYVLEIAAGMAKKTRLRVGEKLKVSGIDLETAAES